MRCGALVLAAGASKRLGRPKQLVRLNGETLLERTVRIAREAGCSPIVVVLGASESEIRTECNLKEAITVFNPGWEEGMGSSLACGVQGLCDAAFGEAVGVVVMTCDMPAVTATHLSALAASGEVMASLYQGRRGVPAYFPHAMFPELLQMRGDAGARELLRSVPGMALDGGALDIDTDDDLARAEVAFGIGGERSGPRRAGV